MTRGVIEVRGLHVRGGATHILKGISLDVRPGEILALIGPAGGGKTTLMRLMTRLTDLDSGLDVSGALTLDGTSVLAGGMDVPELRRRVGIVFSVPTPLPMTIRENLEFGPSLAGARDPQRMKEKVERTLKEAYLWEEVKNRLDDSAMRLSGGQQQRLCLARALMLDPDVLLLDEPCSGLDPISTAKIEEALTQLKKDKAIVLVTNNVKQASRVSDRTAFVLMGDLIETGPTQDLFTSPKDKRTEEYITGRFG